MIEMAILGLLKERPMHGYELKKRLSYLLGHFWTVSYGSLYPALKRLEKANAIERAYSVKKKTRNRNVYRITEQGTGMFMNMLTDTMTDKSLADNDKFDIRMAFFQYLEPETRIRMLEKRRRHLEDQVAKVKAYRRTSREQDYYRSGLMRHKAEIARSDIRWLDKLIADEKGNLNKHKESKDENSMEVESGPDEISAAS
ncbi:MAG: helix-turn-helix transcriptional regulator, partial [Actinobacteria bacterium]|nr:helix-turn-helix transcriptional regulator [Actinomycetota bacterium]